jgi:hypothetical protein
VRKGDESDDRHLLIPVDEILYAFSGAATREIDPVIHAPWIGTPKVRRPDRVWVRTRKGVFVTHCHSLATLHEALDPAQFRAIHQSVIVNLPRMSDVDLAGRRKYVGIRLSDGSTAWTELLVISRRFLRTFRAAVGISRRQHRP